MKLKLTVLELLAWLSISVVAGAQIIPVDLQCEYSESPLGVDVPQPRLSWGLDGAERGQQPTAYHVLVTRVQTVPSVPSPRKAE